MTKPAIAWAKPMFAGGESAYLLEALESTWISGGPFVEELESRIGRLFSMPYALAVANGTCAIHLAYLGIDLKPDDEVIVPGFGFQAAANIALHMHARPVFAEVDPRTWCLTAETIEPHISSKTRAIVPIHTYGNVCEMYDICDLAKEHGIAVIEDVAEAFCSRYRERHAGSFGTVSCFSFQATKTITTGEGGLVLTRDKSLADRMTLYRSHGMHKRRYWHDVPGHNFRLTNLQAALGCSQLNHLDRIVATREHIYDMYCKRLCDEAGLTLQFFPSTVAPVVWAVGCRLDPTSFPQGRDCVMEEMAGHGVETRPGFYPPSVQPLYQTPALPISERVSAEMICLPCYPGLTDQEIDTVCRLLLASRIGTNRKLKVA